MYNDAVSKNLFLRKVKAQDIWKKILHSQIETGLPYIMYKDTVNEKNNQKNIGIIRGSNLCVSPDTMVLTDKGYFAIQLLQNDSVNVWNGREWSETIVRKTGIQQK